MSGDVSQTTKTKPQLLNKMKAKLLLVLAVAAMLAPANLLAGPAAPYGNPNGIRPDRAHKAPKAIACENMVIAANPKHGGQAVVACAAYAKVRANECRIACANK